MNVECFRFGMVNNLDLTKESRDRNLTNLSIKNYHPTTQVLFIFN
jgi:hypothetical protein